MKQSEEARRYVLESVNAGDLRAEQAAEVLGLSERHVRRLLAAYRSRGAPALAHGNRGRRPHNALPPALTEAVVRFAAERYPGANHTHLSELLREHAGLDLSRFTVRRILEQAGMPSPRRRRPPSRSRADRHRSRFRRRLAQRSRQWGDQWNGAPPRRQRRRAATADCTPTRPLEGDPAGPAARPVDAGHRPPARALARHREQLRPRQRRA